MSQEKVSHCSETWGTCLQGSDGRELVADSPLGFLSELKFYFTFPTLHGSAWSSNLARTELQLCLQFSPCFLSCAINHCSVSGKWKPDIGKSGQSSNNTPVLASARHRTFCVLTCTRIWSSRAGDWRWLLLITTLKVFLSPVFFLSPRSDTQKIWGISRTWFHLSQSEFSAEIQHQSCLGLWAPLERPNTSLALVPRPAVPGKALSACPAHSVKLSPALPFWEVCKGGL